MSKILVTGATGQLGAGVTKNLLKSMHASDVRILARDPAKAEYFQSKGVQIAIGNYDDYHSLTDAMKGIDKLFLVSGSDLKNMGKQQVNAVKAAIEAGVKHVVYTGLQRKDDSATSPVFNKTKAHLDTEKQLKVSGMNYTILMYPLYTDIIPFFAGQQLLETKTIYLPAVDGKAAYAVRTDLAEAGARIVLDETGKYDNKFMEITGPEAISWKEIAAIISNITKQDIVYVSPPVNEFKSALTKAGVPVDFISAIADLQQAVAEGEHENVTTELETLLGHKPQTVAAYLQSVYGNN